MLRFNYADSINRYVGALLIAHNDEFGTIFAYYCREYLNKRKMGYEELNYERAKWLYEVLRCPLMIGDMENNPMALSNASIGITNRTLDEEIKLHKNYYPQDEIKYYLSNSWRKFAKLA